MNRICIIISICCPHFSDKSEFLIHLADKLRALKHRVKVILAGKEACSHIIRLQENHGLCSNTFNNYFSQLQANHSDLDPSVINIDNDLEQLVLCSWLKLCDKLSKERIFEKYNLYEICEVSVARRLMTNPKTFSKIGVSNYRETEDAFHKDAVRHLILYRKIFSTWQPDVVIYFGGHFHQDRCAFLISREMGIPAIAIESSFIKEKFYWDTSGVTGNRGRLSDFSNVHWLEAISCHGATSSKVDKMIMDSLGITETIWNNRLEERNLVRTYLDISNSKVVLFLCQVPYDTSIISDGGDFSDQVTAIESILNLLRGLDSYKFMLRVHPKGCDSYMREYLCRLSKTNKDVILLGMRNGEEMSLFSAIVASDIAVTVNSQSGLQAAWCGLPVILLGRAFYGEKGFTFDVLGRRQYLETVFNIATNNQQHLSRKKLMSYLTILESEYLIDPKQIEEAMSKVSKVCWQSR